MIPSNVYASNDVFHNKDNGALYSALVLGAIIRSSTKIRDKHDDSLTMLSSSLTSRAEPLFEGLSSLTSKQAANQNISREFGE